VSKLADLVAEIERKGDEQSAIFDEADEKSEGVLSDEQAESVRKLGAEIADLEKRGLQLKEQEELRAQMEQRRASYRTAGSGRRPEQPGNQHPGESKDGDPRRRLVTVGQEFLDSDEFKEWYVRMGGASKTFAGVGIQSPKVGVKQIITGADVTSAGAMVWPDVQVGLTLLGRRPLVMRDIITLGTTDSDLIEYARVVSETNRAAVVPEATNAYDDNAMKPESEFELEKVQAPVKTIAHMVTTTTRALADAGQLRTMIDGFLRDGVAQALEDEMVTGDGTGEHFEGLESLEGVQDQAFDTDRLVTARRARTKVRVVGRAIATAYLMHPNDWEDFDLMTELAGQTGQYYFGGPRELGVPRLWGLPVIESEAVPEGTAYVGDFRTLVLWDRQQATISLSNSHKDYFQRNLVAILGELRAAFGAMRPVALVRVDLTAGT
jgi:HK97 family phage major capsid protein